MPKLLLALIFFPAAQCCCQDSVRAVYINEWVQRIELRLERAADFQKDTIILEDSTAPAEALHLTFQFFYDPQTRQFLKIIERSRYKQWSTELAVFFLNERPVRLTSTKWEGTKMILDFDLFYFADQPVHFIGRSENRSRPDASFSPVEL